MTARLRKFGSDVSETFWLLPAAIVAALIALAAGLVQLDRTDLLPRWLIDGPFVYNGGGTGARTLLGAVASSTIGVAGTVFSITIASLSLAAGQMGPRLLRNFVRDRGNQVTLGLFLGTFSYALTVLRSVRTHTEGEFVPHLSLSVGIALAFVCVGMLVFFVGHTARRINVDTVIDLVSDELTGAIRRLTSEEAPPAATAPALPADAVAVADPRRGYLQHLDAERLADWAAGQGATVRLLVRPGDYVFPGAPIALVAPAHDGAAAAIRRATALDAQRVSREDLEFAIRQLVEVAVRALSPGINDPHTAMSVLDRLGAALCDLAPRHFAVGEWRRDGRIVLIAPAIDYDGLADAMFHLIRQNAAGSPPVMMRMLEVLAAVAGRERGPARLATLRRHADLVHADADRTVDNDADRADLRRRFDSFAAMVEHGLTGTAVISDQPSRPVT